MRVLIAIILLSSSFASRAQTQDFENYLKQVERNAKGLATMYFGVGTHVTGFEQVPGGAFHFLAHKKTGLRSLTDGPGGSRRGSFTDGTSKLPAAGQKPAHASVRGATQAKVKMHRCCLG